MAEEKKPEYMIVCAYDPTEEDVLIIRSWINLPKLMKISGKVRIRIPVNAKTKDEKESMLDGYCGLMRILHIRYDFHEEKP